MTFLSAFLSWSKIYAVSKVLREKKELEIFLSSTSTSLMLFPLLLALGFRSILDCNNASIKKDSCPQLKIDLKDILNCRTLQLDMRGSCEVKELSVGKSGFVRIGEIKSCLSGLTKQQSISQLVIRLMCTCLTLALCEDKLAFIEAKGFVAVFKSSASFEHVYNFEVPLTVRISFFIKNTE